MAKILLFLSDKHVRLTDLWPIVSTVTVVFENTSVIDLASMRMHSCVSCFMSDNYWQYFVNSKKCVREKWTFVRHTDWFLLKFLVYLKLTTKAVHMYTNWIAILLKIVRMLINVNWNIIKNSQIKNSYCYMS